MDPEPGFAADDEVAQSIRTIQRQRSTKLILMIVGLVGALAVLFLGVVLSYSSEPGAVKNLPASSD